MRIERIDIALQQCNVHIAAGRPVDPAIEGMLTRSILVLICAEFEGKLRELIFDRCRAVSDPSIVNYLGNCVRSTLRSQRIEDITALLGKFGPDHKDHFRTLRERDRQVEHAYTSIMTNRNLAAHGEGVRAAFSDVDRYYKHGHPVLDFFEQALWIDSRP